MHVTNKKKRKMRVLGVIQLCGEAIHGFKYIMKIPFRLFALSDSSHVS